MVTAFFDKTIAAVAAFLTATTIIGGAAEAGTCPIVPAASHGQVVQTAAGELSTFLGEIYPGESFPVESEVPTAGSCVVLGVPSKGGTIAELVSASQVAKPGEFVVTHTTAGDVRIGAIAGSDPKAVLDGVYSLLEQKLGYGFYLNENAHESVATGSFSFDQWDLTAYPLVAERSTLPWHNFLTGPTVWDHDDWLSYVRQVARMRYTHIFIHNYSNNPMLEWTFNGYTKPIGWLNSSKKGRTYAVDHVWDARNMVGADGVIGPNEPVVGSDSADVPDERRAEAAKNMMGDVFAEAAKYGVGFLYAIDIGTHAANPVGMITSTLPASARISSGGKYLVNPDTPEGYSYWKTYIEQLVSDYPEVSSFVTWIRVAGTPATNLKYEDMPADWKSDYDAKLATDTKADTRLAPCAYYWARVSTAWRKVLDEMGRSDIDVGYGSWSWEFEKFFAANLFHPADMRMYVSDYMKKLGKSSFAADLNYIAQKRDITVIDWAQHDDRESYGRPYVPEENYADVMASHKVTGFSVTHWYTRPLDFFFKNVMNQVWSNTKNENALETCGKMAADYWGAAEKSQGTDYLNRWLQKCPMFGTENYGYMAKENKFNTSNVSWVAGECDARIAMLNQMQDSNLSEMGQKRKEFFVRHEEWVKSIHQQTARLHAGTRDAIEASAPDNSIVKFAEAARVLGVTPGDKGMLCHLNFTWLPYFIQLSQQYGLTPYRINLFPTNHDTLARKPGSKTFYYDREQRGWCGLGEKETGVPAKQDTSFGPVSTEEDVCGTWLESSESFSIDITDIIGTPAELSAGDYTVMLLFPAHLADTEDQRVVRVKIGGKDMGTVDVFEQGAVMQKVYSGVSLGSGKLTVSIDKVKGNPVLAGVVLSTDPASVGVRRDYSVPHAEDPRMEPFLTGSRPGTPAQPKSPQNRPVQGENKSQPAGSDGSSDQSSRSVPAARYGAEFAYAVETVPAAAPRSEFEQTAADVAAEPGVEVSAHACPRQSTPPVREHSDLAEESGLPANTAPAVPVRDDLVNVEAVWASSFSGRNLPDRAVDGDPQTHWAPRSEQTAWIECKVAPGASAKGLELTWYGMRGGDDAELTVLGSTDREDFRPLTTAKLRGRGHNKVECRFEPTTAAHLRVEITSGDTQSRLPRVIEMAVVGEQRHDLSASAGN